MITVLDFSLTWVVQIAKHGEGSDDLDPWGVHGDEDHALLFVGGSRLVSLPHEDTDFTVRV